MPDSISTLALRVDSQSAINNLNKFGAAATALGGTTDALRGKIVQLGAAFLSVNFAKRLVSEAAEGQEAFGKYTQVLGRYKDQADKLVTELRSSFNFDATSAQQSIATMTDVFVKSGMRLEQAFESTSALQKRAADLEAFTNAEGGVAAVTHSLTSGILGNAIALRKLGIVINESALKSQMAENKMKGLTFETSNAEKMYARYVLIMKQSQSAMGQIERESDNFANRLRKLRAISADLRNELGDVIIPVATKLVSGADKVIRAFEGTSNTTKTFVVVGGAALGMFAALAPIVLQMATNIALLTGKTIKGTAAQTANTAATIEGTVAKEAETAARLANVNAINAENAALRSQVGSKVASNLDPVGKTSSSETKFGPILSKAEKRELKMAWRAQTEGARKFSRLPGAMPATELGKNVGKKTLGGAGAFANLAPLFSKMTAPLGKLNSVLGKTFTNVLKNVPLITRFSGILGKTLGLFGTAGAVVGGVTLALQAFKKAPQWLEQFLDVAGPKIKEFAIKIPDYLWLGIKEGFDLAKKGAQAAGQLVVDAMVGGAQFGKRLLGFETEASRAYKLNKQIEANNKKRAELLETQRKQLAEEQANLEQQKMAAQARLAADLKFNATKDTDSVKLIKATRDLLQADSDRQNASNAEQLSEANEAWSEAREAVEQFTDSLRASRRAFDEEQAQLKKSLDDIAENEQNVLNQIALENAPNRNARRDLWTQGINNANARLEASNVARDTVNELNAELVKLTEQLDSEDVGKALVDLQELAENGDYQSDAALFKFGGALSRLANAGYGNLDGLAFGEGVPQQVLEQITNQRKADQERQEDIRKELSAQLEIVGQGADALQERHNYQKQLEDDERAFREQQAEEKRAEEERLRQQARSDAAFQRGIGGTYFNRQLSAIDLLYGDDKFGASQARYNLIGQRGLGEWNQSQSDLYAQQTKITALYARMSTLDEKNLAGTLTDDDAKERERLRSQIETLRGEYDSDYQSAIQKRLATEDELLGLENAMREEYLSEAQKWINETTNAWKEQLTAQAQAAEETQRKRLEERSRVEEEARQAVSGMRAITSGSSEAFNVASRIYDRGREELPPEKKIEKSTEQIETVIKAIQEQMANYFRDQSMNGMTLSMEY